MQHHILLGVTPWFSVFSQESGTKGTLDVNPWRSIMLFSIASSAAPPSALTLARCLVIVVFVLSSSIMVEIGRV